MKTLLFDLSIDRSTYTVTVQKQFAAPLADVWDAFTVPELLDQWWAPQPWRSRTKEMNFQVGGRRLYAMVSPEDQYHWSVQEFNAIQPLKSFGFRDAFCDEAGVYNASMPASDWTVKFSEDSEVTSVHISIRHRSLEQLEQIVKMGFEQGFRMTLTFLEQWFSKQSTAPKVVVKALVNADAKKAWEYYTQPEHITKWNFATDDWQCPSASNDLRVGGTYMARMEAKDGSFGFDFGAVYTEVANGSHLTYRIGDGRMVDISFIPQGGQTYVAIVFDAEMQNSPERQRQGWQAILDNYKKYTEKK